MKNERNEGFGLDPEKNNPKRISVVFAAIDKYLQDNIIKNEQKEIKGREIVEYGERNIYPYYLYNLYENVSVLKSVINGIADYACGNDIKLDVPILEKKVNANLETVEDLVRKMVLSLETYGGFALNILRNAWGDIAEIYCLDFRTVRSDKKNTKFYYSTEWADKGISRVSAIAYPAYDPDDKTQASSIYYYKGGDYATYPTPVWGGAVVSAECLKHINEFNLNSLWNSLSSDYIINFNNGVPSDEEKEEIEENFNSKHTSFSNAGRAMMSFNDNYDTRTTVEAIPQTNFLDRYNSLYQTSIKDIFTAFRAHPAIFGLPTENTGFNDSDLREGFKLFNRTVVLPVQKLIKRTFERIFGAEDVIEIEPLDIDFDGEELVEVE